MEGRPLKPARLKLADLESRCQKPDHRRIGNLFARRVSRPLALRITWVMQPYGLSAHIVTLIAWTTGLVAAVSFGWGNPWGWFCGAALMQLWYLLDHVDGQLARLHGAASLDGAQLDYLMHHTMNLALPYGIGFGLFVATDGRLWLLVGLIWGVALLLVGLQHDARYKTFIQRLKRVQGELRVIGGGGDHPEPPSKMPRRMVPLCVWLARKSCEPHVLLNLLSVLALVMWLGDDWHLVVAQFFVPVLGLAAGIVATATLYRSVNGEQAEREFAAWYRTDQDEELIFDDGWWHVRSTQAGHSDDLATKKGRAG